ncbi:NAD-dependent epimerase/dehydratase family protein [Nocardia africana]|uniref:dTDP-glucose 4,6-dehydratase 2 n=1 Tax=Nocardia africana TaxID=134964 RepID=A0A378WWQ1_9NOCA|nr:NAD-dependent epimerase/dehydratase family protein [Nocardia africana]MCC3313862.1 NAD-dependent epimerase/dehydratase family protein [Nocardia africana]SUA44753.1 dTDP-glucose 4,6-dehydratase 2 [Nocardia africana]
MRIGVTGGSGFIGAHVIRRLAESGHTVYALDTVAPSRPDPRAQFRRLDVLDPAAVIDASADLEVIFHLAGMSNVDVAQQDPLRTVRLNVDGTANVLEAARVHGLRRMVFASTVWVYGAAYDTSGGAQPLTEAAPMSLAKAGHIYTSTKIAAEMLIHSYAETYEVPFTILRYGVPYGPGMRDELVLARFVRKAIAGEPLTIAGDGKQFRNYVFVEDLAEAHAAVLAEAAENQVIALEGSERVSVLDMAEAVRARFPGTTIEHVPARPGDFRGIDVSNALARSLIGWRPTTSFQDGVRQYVEWYLAEHPEPAAAGGSG